jgi:hypothetical protein
VAPPDGLEQHDPELPTPVPVDSGDSDDGDHGDHGDHGDDVDNNGDDGAEGDARAGDEPQPTTGETGDDASGIPGNEGDEGADNAAPPVEAAPVDCGPLATGGATLCASRDDGCEGVFTDRSGCTALCARAGLVCRASYDDVDGQCAADLDRPALGCADTGHGSDYCVCGRPGVCTPQCGDAQCGSDGCGGQCGACANGLACDDGRCVASNAREGLLAERVGYAHTATGGAGGRLCEVTNLNDSGDGSFRSCAQSDEARWIVFGTSGTIRLNSAVNIGSNTTVDGRGAQITFESRGFVVRNKRNVIIHNGG